MLQCCGRQLKDLCVKSSIYYNKDERIELDAVRYQFKHSHFCNKPLKKLVRLYYCANTVRLHKDTEGGQLENSLRERVQIKRIESDIWYGRH